MNLLVYFLLKTNKQDDFTKKMKSGEVTQVLQEALNNLIIEQTQITSWKTHLKNICLWFGFVGLYPNLKITVMEKLSPNIRNNYADEIVFALPIIGIEIYEFFSSIFKSRNLQRKIDVVKKLLYVSDGMDPKDKQSILASFGI
jgi:hypothetical protein